MPVEAPKPVLPSGRYAGVKIDIAIKEAPLVSDPLGGVNKPDEGIDGFKRVGKADTSEPQKGVVAPMVFDEKGGDQD